MTKLIGFRPPERLLRKFEETLKKAGGKRGDKNQVLVEAMEIWVAYKNHTLVRCRTAGGIELKDFEELNVLEGEGEILPIGKEFEEDQLFYLAGFILGLAKKNKGSITVAYKEENTGHVVHDAIDPKKLSADVVVSSLSLSPLAQTILHVGKKVVILKKDSLSVSRINLRIF